MDINISDRSILNSLNNQLNLLKKDSNTYKNNEDVIIGNKIDAKNRIYNLVNILKITNNKLINYTGIKLYIKYANNEYYCEPLFEIKLDYINDWDFKHYQPKQISFSINSKKFFYSFREYMYKNPSNKL